MYEDITILALLRTYYELSRDFLGYHELRYHPMSSL